MFSIIKKAGLSGCLVLLLGTCGVSSPVDMPRSLLFGGSAQEFVIDRGLDQDQANIQILDDFYKSREIDDEFTNTIKEEIASYGLGYLQGRFRLGLGIGNTFAAISSGFCANKNNTATDFCVFWAQYGLLINLGMLSASSLDLLYAKLSKSYNELPKGSFEGTNQKFLEDELDLKGSIVGEGVKGAGSVFNNFSKAIDFGGDILKTSGKKLNILGRANPKNETIGTKQLFNELKTKGVPENEMTGLFTQMPSEWNNLSVIDMNTKYWNEINKIHIDDIISNGGDIRFIHDPRLAINEWNYVADMPTATVAQIAFKNKCVAEGLVKIKTFMKMEYDYLLSKGYVLQETGLMIKP